MTNKQQQRADEGAVAAQAGRDLTINQGISPEQMIQIMDAVSSQIRMFSETAEELVNQRLNEFKEEVVDRFASDEKAQSEAFSDPDFQYSLFNAQKAYARTGDEDLQEVLIDLVVQRSKQSKRDRLMLTINDAIERASSLTEEDFSILAMIFWMRMVSAGAPANVVGLAQCSKKILDPLIDHIPSSEIAFQYLDSHGCIRIQPMTRHIGFIEQLIENYSGILTNGLEYDEIVSLFPIATTGNAQGLIRPSSFAKDKFVLEPGNMRILEQVAPTKGLANDFVQSYLKKAEKNRVTNELAVEKIREHFERVDLAIEKYDNTLIRICQLTTVGIALAHAYLTKKVEFDADLSIWIK